MSATTAADTGTEAAQQMMHVDCVALRIASALAADSAMYCSTTPEACMQGRGRVSFPVLCGRPAAMMWLPNPQPSGNVHDACSRQAGCNIGWWQANTAGQGRRAQVGCWKVCMRVAPTPMACSGPNM